MFKNPLICSSLFHKSWKMENIFAAFVQSFRTSRQQMSEITLNLFISQTLLPTLVNCATSLLQPEMPSIFTYPELTKLKHNCFYLLPSLIGAASTNDWLREAEGGTMCVLCSRVMKHRQDAVRHVRLKHSSTHEEVHCEICGKVLKHHWALGDHMRKTHGQSAKSKYQY